MIDYVKSLGDDYQKRPVVAKSLAAKGVVVDGWDLGLARLCLLLGQDPFSCDYAHLAEKVDAERLARKMLGTVGLFSQLAAHIAHYLVLLYNIYHSDRMTQVILSGGVLKGRTGPLVRRQAEGFLLKGYNKVFGPGKHLTPGCIVLGRREDAIVPDDSAIGPYGAAMVASRAHKAAAWHDLNERIRFRVQTLQPGQSLKVAEIHGALGRTRFAPADVRACLQRFVSEGGAHPPRCRSRLLHPAAPIEK